MDLVKYCHECDSHGLNINLPLSVIPRAGVYYVGYICSVCKREEIDLSKSYPDENSARDVLEDIIYRSADYAKRYDWRKVEEESLRFIGTQDLKDAHSLSR